MTRLESDRARDEGFTLVELLIYSVLLVIVVSIVGGLVISSVRTSNDVRSSTSAAGQGQLIATSVNTEIRQASWVKVVQLSAGQFVVARTTTGDASLSWQCTAWYFDATGDGTIYTISSTTNISQPATTPTTWTLLAEGVTATGNHAFAISPAVTPLPASSTGKGLTIDVDMTVGDRSPIPIQSTTLSRQSSVESAPCS
jgi:Tfp pilus assembly protein PilW